MRPPTRARRTSCGARRVGGALVLLAALGRTAAVLSATLVINVHTPDGHALSGAVVTARPLDAPARRPTPLHAVMDQGKRAFAPDLLVIPVGSTVAFPNSDSVSHQIYSFSAAKRFQLPLYHGKPYPPVQFDQTRVITLGCNIHDDMLAYLLVTDAAYFGRTDAHGAWSVEVPRGRYQVSIWHPRLRESDTDLQRELTAGDADRADPQLHLLKPLQPAPIPARPHSWDY